MAKIDQIVTDVLDKLNRNNGGICPDENDTRKVINGLARVFDRFSIDARKIPVIQQLEFDINRCSNRFTIGCSGDFETWDSPQTIYYAAWKHNPKCGCTADVCCDRHQATYYGGLGEEPIKIMESVQEFHLATLNREFYNQRPQKMWWQQSKPNGEIIFDCVPLINDKLMLRVAMPFNVALKCDKPKKEPDEWEFYISNSCRLCCDVAQDILCRAQHDFNACDDWCYHTQAETCDPCPVLIDVIVTAKRKPKISVEPITMNSIELPHGYCDALVDILAYDVAPALGAKRTGDLKQDKNEAIVRIHRNNERKSQDENEVYFDNTLPWNNRAAGIGC